MTREIKFRGKVKHHDPMTNPENGWVEGYYLQDLTQGEMRSYIFQPPCSWEVIPETVGQFTGLLDKNGKAIYEGDIIFSQKCDCRAILHKVEYNVDNAMFVAKPIQGWDFDFCQIRKDWIDKYDKEVIGNVFDNPELLKAETL